MISNHNQNATKPKFALDSALSIHERFEKFIKWGEPFGEAGINHIHFDTYDQDAPYFSWSANFLGFGDRSQKTWFLKREFEDVPRSVYTSSFRGDKPIILNSNGIVLPSLFLRFAKAYLNVMMFYRSSKSTNKPCFKALLFIEQALRHLNDGENSPINICKFTFEKAHQFLIESKFSKSQKYDIGREFEIMVGMLQGGYRSKSNKLEGYGFRILQKAFAFSCGMKVERLSALSLDRKVEARRQRFTNEQAAACGLAYSRAKTLFGEDSTPVFIAAAVGITLTTASMRLAELLLLRRDALSLSEDENARSRLRIERPKIGQHQILPIPKKLVPIIKEFLEVVTVFTKEAHEALAFYVKNFSDDFNRIDRLFIPERIKPLLEKEFLTFDELQLIFERKYSSIHCQKVRPVLHFVEHPQDISPLVGITSSRAKKLVRISVANITLAKHGVTVNFPIGTDEYQYITKTVLMKYCKNVTQEMITEVIDPLFSRGKRSASYVKTDDVIAFLLMEFKRNTFVHWPYLSKDRSTKIDEALLVWPSPNTGRSPKTADKCRWWCPSPISPSLLSHWVTGTFGEDPLLFSLTNVRLNDGKYPSFTMHQTRKYHHTEALLAGVNPLLADELAGRQTGYQSTYYDTRTPHEIIFQSIETFDPGESLNVFGPIEVLSHQVNIVERNTFLFENASPKHLTEVGGCTTDWALDPCDQFGGCTRCDKQVWQKGDLKRLPHISEKKEHAILMIAIAEKKVKLGNPPHSLLRQLQQFKDDLSRCESILKIEDDQSIPLGSLITFELPKGAEGIVERTVRLRQAAPL